MDSFHVNLILSPNNRCTVLINVKFWNKRIENILFLLGEITKYFGFLRERLKLRVQCVGKRPGILGTLLVLSQTWLARPLMNDCWLSWEKIFNNIGWTGVSAATGQMWSRLGKNYDSLYSWNARNMLVSLRFDSNFAYT